MDYKLPFLDMLVIRDPSNGDIMTDWYRKPVSSGRILNFKSFHPLSQKISTCIGFIDRVLKLSTPLLHRKNKNVIMDLLSKNDYPRPLISRLFNRTLGKITSGMQNGMAVTNLTANGSSVAPDNLTPNSYHSMGYVPGVSERIKKSIGRFVDGVIISFKCVNSMGRLYTKTKDKIPALQQSDIVYSIPCGDCRKRYIGTTSQLFKIRIGQHEGYVRQNKPEASALAAHALEYDHQFDFGNAGIVARNRNYFKRFFLEELHIKNTKMTVNIKSKDSKNVSNIYSHLFDKLNRLN